MKLFIDTTNSIFKLGLLDGIDLLDFEEIETNNDIAKNANKWIDDFFTRNKIKISDIKYIYVTIGPGTFTGTKIGYSISQTMKLVNEEIRIYSIDSLLLQKEKENNFSAVKISKNKYVLRRWILNIPLYTKIVDVNDLPKKSINIDYKDFDGKKLIFKLRKFKRVKNYEEKLIFPRNNFITKRS